MNLFFSEIEQTAIVRIQKFARIAKAMNFDVCLGFFGGKDSQVCYDLCRRSGIKFTAYFNHSFESSVTLNFIKRFYPDVVWRRDYKFGFIENIKTNHAGMFPTVERAYCCKDYKHNPKYVDACSIVGVRKAESPKRAKRTTFEIKNKTIKKRNTALFNEYFEEHCQSTGAAGIIQLKPIIDWSDDDVWEYIERYNLPVNPEYKLNRRVGCIVCPKANFSSNYKSLLKYPKLIDCFIRAREGVDYSDWTITSENRDYSDNKPYYICRWLNHSFRPFSKTQEKQYLQVRRKYDEIHK